jgi:hypothetical protein
MIKLLIGIEGSAASSNLIVLRLELSVNPVERTQPSIRDYRVSGLVYARDGVPLAGRKSLSKLATTS